MVFRAYSSPWTRSLGQNRAKGLILLTLVALSGSNLLRGQQSVSADDKHIIGATAIVKEAGTGIPFRARIDTGAKSCSLHVEKIEIIDEGKSRLRNIGKTVHFLVKGSSGKTEWIESRIAAAVRIKSSVFKNGEFDRRYKVRLTLQWKEFRKEVLVTLNDRTEMAYPLLIGRNFLRGDFLVDVDQKSDAS